MLEVRGLAALVVGGGSVGTRRAKRLAAAGARVRVLDPAWPGPGPEDEPNSPGEPSSPGDSAPLGEPNSPGDSAPPGENGGSGSIEWLGRTFEPADLAGVRLVVVATTDPAANARVAAAVAALPEPRPWINRADEAGAGDLGFMATANAGPLTVAVDSGGASAAEARRLASELAGSLDPDRARLLAAVASVRPLVKGLVNDPDERGRLLREMTSPEALALLKQRGGEALESWLGGLLGQARKAADPPAPGRAAESAGPASDPARSSETRP